MSQTRGWRCDEGRVKRAPCAPDLAFRSARPIAGRSTILSSSVSMSPNVLNRPVAPADLPLIAELQARVFGPGRFTRTAYRVREGAPPISRFCRLALLDGRIIASVRFTDITIGGVGGALLLGPLAVDPDFAGKGFGRQLIAESLEAAKADGVCLVVLVGDEPYYGRFGFRAVPPGQITLPGPVDARRLLAAELVPGALAGYRGSVVAERR
jgi:predicted N-acetyltransferase YhbS